MTQMSEMNKAITLRTEAVRSEVRKLTTSKPVAAAAGAGALATAALRELPGRIARLRSEMPVYMTTARTRALQEYDKLAVTGQRVLRARTGGPDGGTPKA
jgi:hypothetical protein